MRDMKVLLRKCERLGCQVIHRRNNHFTIILPWGPRIFVAGTPSDRRAIYNILAELRRRGLDI